MRPKLSSSGRRRVAGVRGEGRGLHLQPGSHRQRRQDRVHLGSVLGLPQTQRSALARQPPKPPKVSQEGQLTRPLGLARRGGIHSLGRCACGDGEGERGQELAASRVRMTSTAACEVPSGTRVVIVRRYSTVRPPLAAPGKWCGAIFVIGLGQQFVW